MTNSLLFFSFLTLSFVAHANSPNEFAGTFEGGCNYVHNWNRSAITHSAGKVEISANNGRFTLSFLSGTFADQINTKIGFPGAPTSPLYSFQPDRTGFYERGDINEGGLLYRRYELPQKQVEIQMKDAGGSTLKNIDFFYIVNLTESGLLANHWFYCQLSRK